jgi:hypothetical protein
MQERLSLFAAHLGVGIAEDEANGGKEVALAGAVATDNNIMLWREGLNHCLFFVADDRQALAANLSH